MLYFIIGFAGLIIGSFIGIVLTCIMAVSSKDSRAREKQAEMLISKQDLIKHFNDWALTESPENEPDVAKEYTAKDMQSMVYRTIRESITAIEEFGRGDNK